MPLSSGVRLGPYEILAPLGAGGMGEVYRAKDARLGRDVALKVLPEVFSKDPERMARFEREAQVLASLNHPNIAALYGVEESGGVRALVMELVEGPTLADRLREGPVGLNETLPIARQIAEALEAAHDKGIVHRDLKPANIKVTHDGVVKVLDFGLAKALDDDPAASNTANSPTISLAATRAGVILGTAAYMSPEQAKGKPADRRADIWSFGAVLCEMLTGRRLYSGETAAETLASVMKDEPKWDLLPSGTPAAIRKLLRRCLEKDAKRRLQAIGEARILIEDLLAGRPEAELESITAPRPKTFRRRHVLSFGAGLALVAALAALAAWTLKPFASELPLRKLELAAGKVQAAYGSPISVSPDGRRIAYVSGNHLWIRELDQFEPRQVDNSEGAIRPFWSPDSTFAGYAAGERIWKAPAGGGQSVAVCVLPQAISDAGGGAWSVAGRIIFSTGSSGLMEVSAQGGDPKKLLEPNPESEYDFHHPSALPDGRGVVFVVHNKTGVDGLAAFTERGRKKIFQLQGQRLTNPVYSPTGHILYYRMPNNLGIWALPFSLSKLEATGEPFLAFPSANDPSVSSDGTLAFVRGDEMPLTQLAWMNRGGQMEGVIGEPQQHGSFLGFIPALSPDGRRLAAVAGDLSSNDVWVHDLARGSRIRLTGGFAPSLKHMPVWSPSGDRIAFMVGGSVPEYAVWLRAADGTGEPQKLALGMTPEFSPDGKLLVYAAWRQPDWDLWYLPLEGDRKPVAILKGPGWRISPRVSPDGRYLAYSSNESGRYEVYLTRFPGGAGNWQVSVNGGHWPRWNRSGDRLFYAEPDQSLMEVEVRTHPTMALGKPQKLFARKPSSPPGVYAWAEAFDVSPDGKRFILLQPVGPNPGAAGITVVQNWFAEFKNRK